MQMHNKFAEAFGVDGVIIADVIPDGLAEQLGIKGTYRDEYDRPFIGDIIVEINHQQVKKTTDVQKILEQENIQQIKIRGKAPSATQTIDSILEYTN